MKDSKVLKIFIASPGDCALERQKIRELASADPTIKSIIDTYNLKLEIRGWEDIEPDIGRPQSLINKDIHNFDPDWIVFIFWSRIGTDAGSGNGWTGTEEEWQLALKMNKQGGGRPRISIFRNVEEIPQLQLEEEQFSKLDKFINGVFKRYEALAKTYKGAQQFESLFRSYIVNHIIKNKDAANTQQQLKNQLLNGSDDLLRWPSTLNNGVYIIRNEIDEIIDRIQSTDFSTQLILGPKGTGKSSLLSVLGNKVIHDNITTLCIKADVLPTNIDNLHKLSHDFLGLNIELYELIYALAIDQKVVIVIDQLDALSELTDQKTNRLQMLLLLIKTLSNKRNIHIVASCRDFEYRLDPRLSKIEATPIYLTLPSWEDVEPNVKEIGFNTESFSPNMRELLRTPLNLNLFMQVASPGDVFDSLQSLLQAVWEKEVEGGNNQRKVDFIEKLALRMAEEEIFWIYTSMIDGDGEILQQLFSADILVRSDDKKSIGFRHQTFVDFVMTKIFAKKGLRFSQYIRENQDSLFIRGTVISTLNYLRSAAPKTYYEELVELFHNKPRKHLWILIIEFLGSQTYPTDEEKELLESVLHTEDEGAIVLRAISNSTALVEYFINRESLSSWMRKKADNARYCLPVLCRAAINGNTRVNQLLKNIWLNNTHEYERLIWSVLTDIRIWDDDSLTIVDKLVTKEESFFNSHIIGNIAEQNPQAAIRIYKKVMEIKYKAAVNQSLRLEKNNKENDIFSGPRKPFEKIITEDMHYLADVGSLAEVEPVLFLKDMWALFIKAINRAAYEEHEWVNDYRQDFVDNSILDKEDYRDSFGDCILTAIISLAQKHPKKFLQFVTKNKNSNLMLVHQLLSIGLIELDKSRSQFIFEYITNDDRRFQIGKNGSSHYFTSKLLSKIYPHLNVEHKEQINRKILKYNYYKQVMPEWNATDRLNRLRWNRQHRLFILRALPEDCTSSEIKKLINEEIRALGNVEDDERKTWGGFVGARITLDEMELAKNNNIITLFEKLSDNQLEENFSRKFSRDVSRSGGARELGNVFKEFSKKNVRRTLELLENLTPDKHQVYVSSAIEGLCESEVTTNQLWEVLEKVVQRGFGNELFIERVSHGLENRASKEGLPDNFITLLKKWIEIISEPTGDQYQFSKQEEYHQPIFFGHGASYILPSGRATILRAIGYSYLKRKRPAVSSFLEFLERRISKETNAAVWSCAIRILQFCIAKNHRTRTMRVFTEIITKHPEVFLYEETLIALPRFFKVKNYNSVQIVCLEKIKEINRAYSNQAYGELLFSYFYLSNDNWAKERLSYELQYNQFNILLGITYATTGLWRYFSDKGFLLQILSVVVDQENEHIHSAIGNIFYELEESDMDNQLITLIEKIIVNPLLLQRVADPLIEYLLSFVSNYSDIVYRASNNLIDITGERLTDISSSLALVTDNLTSVAVTLQRNRFHRSKGIELFERLLTINAREAKEAIELLDRLPTKALSSGPTFRRRKRRKKKI
ncbi:MAG: AAA family ATPase [Bacillota bacterium]